MKDQYLDVASEGLAHPYRRLVCQYLAGRDDPLVTLVELSEYVSQQQGRSVAPGIESDVSRDVRLHLHHVHLPKLDDADIVEYDAGRQLVERGVAFPGAVAFLWGITEADECPGEPCPQ